jgi:hypothetical protein
MQRSKKVFPFIMLLITALACAIPGVSQNTDAVSTSAAETVVAGFTQNAPVPSTFTAAATFTRTFTPTLIYLTSRFPSETPTLPVTPGTETPTVEATQTFTPFPVIIRVTRPTNCRAGPDTSFDVVGSFLVGMKAEVIGRDATSHFYYIPNPYVYTDYCWVSGKYAEFEGNPLLLPVVVSPPTSTATGTTEPSLDFKLQGSGFQSCNGVFWMNIEITSESKIPFESVQIETLDKDRNVTRTLAANNFVSATGCGGLTVNDTITNGTAVLVSTAKFDYNFKGDTMRAYVTVCAQDDIKGTCTTREAALKP